MRGGGRGAPRGGRGGARGGRGGAKGPGIKGGAKVVIVCCSERLSLGFGEN